MWLQTKQSLRHRRRRLKPCRMELRKIILCSRHLVSNFPTSTTDDDDDDRRSESAFPRPKKRPTNRKHVLCSFKARINRYRFFRFLIIMLCPNGHCWTLVPVVAPGRSSGVPFVFDPGKWPKFFFLTLFSILSVVPFHVI